MLSNVEDERPGCVFVWVFVENVENKRRKSCLFSPLCVVQGRASFKKQSPVEQAKRF